MAENEAYSKESIALKYFREGVTAQTDLNFQESIELFRRATELVPENPVFLGAICESYCAIGNFLSAVEVGEKALAFGEIFPSHSAAFGLSLAFTGEPEVAKDYIEMQLSENPDNHDLLVTAGTLEVLSGNTDSAARWFELAIQLEPESFEAYCGLALLESNTQNWYQAALYYSSSLKINSDYKPAVQGYVESLWQLGEHSLNVDFCDGLDPRLLDDDVIASRYALSLCSLGRNGEAESVIGPRSIDQSSKFFTSVFYGGLLKSQHRRTRAISAFRLAKAKSDDDREKVMIQNIESKLSKTMPA